MKKREYVKCDASFSYPILHCKLRLWFGNPTLSPKEPFINPSLHGKLGFLTIRVMR